MFRLKFSQTVLKDQPLSSLLSLRWELCCCVNKRSKRTRGAHFTWQGESATLLGHSAVSVLNMETKKTTHTNRYIKKLATNNWTNIIINVIWFLQFILETPYSWDTTPLTTSHLDEKWYPVCHSLDQVIIALCVVGTSVWPQFTQQLLSVQWERTSEGRQRCV